MSTTLLAQTQALIAAHSKALSDAIALGHSLAATATSANERTQAAAEAASKAAAADGNSAIEAIAAAIGPNGALTQQLAAWHAQYAGIAGASTTASTTAAAPSSGAL